MFDSLAALTSAFDAGVVLRLGSGPARRPARPAVPPADIETYGLTPDLVDLVGLLRHRAAGLGEQRAYTFLIDGEQERRHVTYAQLDARARAIAGRLQREGLAGERALLLFPSGLEFIAAFFGCLYAGVVAVPAYPPRRNRNLNRIRSIVSDCAPRIVLTTDEVYGRVEPVLRDEPELSALAWQCTAELGEADAAAWREPDVTHETLAFLQYTSGSTGTPKGVMVSHGNLMHNTAMISRAFQARPAAIGVTWLPLYHDMGLIGGIIQPIYFARPTTVMTPAHFLQKPMRWLQALSDTGAAISGGPNFAYELCVDRVTEEEKKTIDLSQWEVAFNGAEPVRAETLDRFAEAFAPCGFRREAFFPCYGLAESTLYVAGCDKRFAPTVRTFDAEALQNGAAVEAVESAAESMCLVGSGRPSEDQQVVIADPDTLSEKPSGEIGEIWVSGPSVAQGYWNRPDVTEETFAAHLTDGRGPFLRTGDLGCLHVGMDGHTELFINGRCKDLIILRGVNHYPQDLEHTVEESHEDLASVACAAFAVGDVGAERLVIVQEVGRKREIDFAEVTTAVRRRLGEIHEVAPQDVVLIKPNSIPKTSSGKIQRHACRDAYLAGELEVVARSGADGSLDVLRKRKRRPSAGPSAAETPMSVASRTAPAPPPVAPDPDAEPDDTVARVMAIVRQVGQERATDLTLQTDIGALGLDSLERMEIVAALEQDFGGRFTEDAILSMETCGDVVEQVERCLLGREPQSHTDAEVAETVVSAPAPAMPGADADREIPLSDYVFTESLEYRRLRSMLDGVEAMGLRNPYFTEHEGVSRATTTFGGREYVNFASYNYLGMSGDPAVHAAAKEAIDRYGTSTSASRLVSGQKTLHLETERAIADFLGVEATLLFPSGHSTNETVVGHLFGPGDLILHDALAHNCIIQGCKLSGALRRAFPHNDHRACGELLKKYRHEYRRVLIAIEGVYSMDGDWADVRPFAELRREHKTYLMIDEAHSFGVMGAHGRGMSEHCGLAADDVDLWMGTISKAIGSVGGYIGGSAELIEYLRYTAPGFVFSGGIAPPNTAAALAAIRVLQAEPQRVERLHANASLFLRLAQEAGFDTGPSDGTPIVPIITGDSRRALALSTAMLARGVNVQPILHPAVEESAARLRFFVSASHTEEHIRDAAAKLVEADAEVRETLRHAPDAAIGGEASETMMAASPARTAG